VFSCIACGATAVNKVIKMFDPCIPLRHGNTNHNLKAYKAGKAPLGFPLWHYNHIHACQTTGMNTIQTKVDNLVAASKKQARGVSSDEESMSNDKDLLDVPNSPSGSSGSD